MERRPLQLAASGQGPCRTVGSEGRREQRPAAATGGPAIRAPRPKPPKEPQCARRLTIYSRLRSRYTVHLIFWPLHSNYVVHFTLYACLLSGG